MDYVQWIMEGVDGQRDIELTQETREIGKILTIPPKTIVTIETRVARTTSVPTHNT